MVGFVMTWLPPHTAWETTCSRNRPGWPKRVQLPSSQVLAVQMEMSRACLHP